MENVSDVYLFWDRNEMYLNSQNWMNMNWSVREFVLWQGEATVWGRSVSGLKHATASDTDPSPTPLKSRERTLRRVSVSSGNTQG